jgi:hypothetical protein
MHRIARVRTRKVRDTRARHDEMRGIRMIDRHADVPCALDGVVVEPQIDPGDAREIVEPHAAPNGVARELQHAVVSRQHVERDLVVADAGDAAPAGVVLQLQESHRVPP